MKISEGYYYAHKAVVAMVIEREINYVLNETFLNVKDEKKVIDKKTYEDKVVAKSEGEFTGAIKLVPQLPNWVNVIVADALYFNAPFIKGVLRTSKQAVIRLKDTTSNVYDTINHTVIYQNYNDSFIHKEDNKKFTVKFWYKDTAVVDSTILTNNPGKKTDIRIYKFVEVVESTVKKENCFTFREIYVGTTDKNFSAKTI